MAYDKKLFPHYGKVPFPEHLEIGETVWAGEWIGGGIDFYRGRSSGPFAVIRVQDRSDNVSPLITVRDEKLGTERDLCATMLTREAPQLNG